VDDEFAEVGLGLRPGISAVPDDLFSSESEERVGSRTRTSRLSFTGRGSMDRVSDGEEDSLGHTMELEAPAKRRAAPERDVYDSSGPEIEFVLREFDDAEQEDADF
jgi:hypothetical protein